MPSRRDPPEPDPATASTIGGIKVKGNTSENTDTKVYTQIETSSYYGYVTLKNADNSYAGVVKLSDDGSISYDMLTHNNTKACTPAALSYCVGNEVDSKFWMGTTYEYSQITPQTGVFYYIYDI